MNIFKYTDKLKELHSKHLNTCHLYSTMKILQYLLYNLSVHVAITVSVINLLYFLLYFKVK